MTNTITFAIGDIHGMNHYLHNILESIHWYIKDNNVEDWKIVFLGDYIDRGPDSNFVLSTIQNKQEDYPGKIITLRGNHEDMFLNALNGGYSELHHFIANGGDATLASFGVTKIQDVPFKYKQFIRDTVMLYEDDLRYFVHAGINRSKPLSEQSDLHRLWIREGFLDYEGQFEKHVVHGHTVKWAYDKEDPKSNRTNLDYGAFCGGALVCGVFNNIQAAPIKYLTYQDPIK